MISLTFTDCGIGVQEHSEGHCTLQITDETAGINVRIPIPKEGRDVMAKAIKGSQLEIAQPVVLHGPGNGR